VGRHATIDIGPWSRWVVRWCYRLDDSRRYRHLKRLAKRVLEDPKAPPKRYFDAGMIVLVVSSVWLLIYDVRHPLGPAAILFEHFVVSVFIVEYLLRAWVHDDMHRVIIEHVDRAELVNIPFRLGPAVVEIAANKWGYAHAPLAIIDLLAILPDYRALRMLRILVLFRMLKLFRYLGGIGELAGVLKEKRFEFLILGIFLGFITLASATSIYLFEGDRSGASFTTFFDALYWSIVTLSTVGYGDITPHTTEGRIVAMVLILGGIAFITFTTSIFVSALTERLHGLREGRVRHEVEKLKNHTVVCGYGRVGRVVVDRLAREALPFVVVESDERKVEWVRKNGHLAVQGDAARDDILEQLGVRRHAETIICTTHDDVANVFITLSARHMNPGISIIARANASESIHKLELAGADHVVAPLQLVGLVAAQYVGMPVAFEAVLAILRGARKVVVDAITALPGSFLDQARVGEIDFAAHRLVLFGVVPGAGRELEHESRLSELRGRHFHFNPGPDVVLGAKDTLVVFGHELSIAHFRRQVELSLLERTPTRA